MKINEHIFREYDIRGTVGTELSDEFAYLLGRAYGTLARENKKDQIAIGYDARESSPGYAAAICRGMNDEGVSCVDIGLGPTPQVYWAIFNRKLGGGIQITGSHNPPDMNGFKICLGEKTLSGPEIQDLKRRVLACQKNPASEKNKGSTKKLDLLQSYIDDLTNNCKPHMGPRKLKIVVDAGNGVGGITGPKVLRGLGAEIIELYCEPDGNFPNHHPDPTVMENLEDLIDKVKETKADFGIGWDGDADRIGVVDEQGQVIFGDMLLLIYARDVLKKDPGATIIGDVKCSTRLFDDIKKHGGNPIMWKTGHSLIKNRLREVQGALGGEMSGHIFFKHRFYGFDDAVYCSARLAEIMSHFQGKASELLKDVPKMVATPEIRVDCPEEIKFKIPELAKAAFKQYEVSTMDGIRINFENGWGLIRASNTQPVLVMRFEAKSSADLEKYQSLVVAEIEKIKTYLLQNRQG